MMPPAPPADARPAAHVWLFVLAAAVAAVVVDLSDTHRGHHADSVIPVLTSLYHWEPFYWGSDRNGQLLPLLAAPFADPFVNLLVQFGLSVFAGAAALGLFARLVAPAGWPAVAAGAWAVVLFGYGEYIRFNMLNPCHPYTASLCAFGGAVWAAAGPGRGVGRWAAAAGLAAVAGWVNVGLGLCLGPWLLAGAVLGGTGLAGLRRVDYLRGLLLLAFATVVGLALQRLTDYPGAGIKWLPVAAWPDGWRGVVRDLTWHFGGGLKASAGLTAVGLVWLAVPATRGAAVRHLLAAVGAAVGLAAGVGLSGAWEWVASNGYTSRYLFPSLLLLHVAAAAAAFGPPLAALGPVGRRRVGAAACVVVAALPLAVYGRPSVAAARGALDQLAPGTTEAVVAGRCTHVCGDYWEVWPLVLRANVILAERGEGRVVWGIAPRAEPTRPKWAAVPPAEVRVGCLVRSGGGPPGEWQEVFPHLRLAERGAVVWIYTAPD